MEINAEVFTYTSASVLPYSQPGMCPKARDGDGSQPQGDAAVFWFVTALPPLRRSL